MESLDNNPESDHGYLQHYEDICGSDFDHQYSLDNNCKSRNNALKSLKKDQLKCLDNECELEDSSLKHLNMKSEDIQGPLDSSSELDHLKPLDLGSDSEHTLTVLSGAHGTDVSSDISLGSVGELTDSLCVKMDNINYNHQLEGNVMLPDNTTNLVRENLVLVGTSKGLLLSVTSLESLGFSSSCISTMTNVGGSTILTSSIPGTIYPQIQIMSSVQDTHNRSYDSLLERSVLLPTSIFTDANTVPLLQHLEAEQFVITTEEMDGQIKVRKHGGGWPKGKKRKPGPDVQTPRKPVTGYVIFAVKRRQEIKMTNPDLPFAEVTKLLGQEWSNLDSEKKAEFMRLAKADKERYILEMKQFQQSDIYRTFIKNKHQDSQPSIISHHMAHIDRETEENTDELCCKVCDQYFISMHNKKEHLFGRQHLQNLKNEISKDIQQQSELEKQQTLDVTAMLVSHANTLTGATLGDGNLITTSADIEYASMDINEFIQEFVRKNSERENEIKILQRCHQSFEEDNIAMSKQIKELEEYESKLGQDVGSLKAYGTSLSAQLDTLKMVPTLFGVINF